MKQQRIDNTLKLMEKEELDGVIYALGANMQYLLDCVDLYWQRTCMTNIVGQMSAYLYPEVFLYLKNDGDLRVFTNLHYYNYFKDKPCPVTLSYMDQFEDALAPYVKGKKIGLGYGCRDYLKELLAAIDPKIETVDAEDLLWSIRCIKDEDEIAKLKAIAKFTDEAVAWTLSNFCPGMTQIEAENLLIKYGLDHGVADLSFPPTIGFKTQNHITSADVEYYDRYTPLVAQTGMAFDVGYMNEGYCSDWGRTLYYGKAPSKIKDAYKALQSGQVHMVESIVPNKTNINELYGLVKAKVTELGFGDDLRFPDSESLGHQIGIDCHEFPMVNKDYDYVLRPGMVFASEPKMFFKDECYMRVEDIILIKEDHAEFLTNFDRDRFEIEL